MDKRVRDMYHLMLIRQARVVRFLEYKNYYEAHLEWDSLLPPSFYSKYDRCKWEEIIETKLIAFEKIRR